MSNAHALERATSGVARSGHPEELRGEFDVLDRRERRIQHALMRDEPHDRARGRATGELDAGHSRRAARWTQQSREHPEEGRLPCSVRSEERETIAATETERDVPDRIAATEPAAESDDVDRDQVRRADRVVGRWRGRTLLGGGRTHARTLVRRAHGGEDRRNGGRGT